MPDSWSDVKRIADNNTGVPRTPPQNAYVGVLSALQASGSGRPTDAYSDAECLYMIVIQGGVVDCLDCGGLASAKKGDTDADGAFEFLDAWDEPIRYVLWPNALELPPGSGKFFSSTRPFSSGTVAPAKGGTMRPLIFSAGPDKKNTIAINGDSNFGPTSPSENPDADRGGFVAASEEDKGDYRADNVTNFDAESKK
jgi:hypothetical protein